MNILPTSKYGTTATGRTYSRFSKKAFSRAVREQLRFKENVKYICKSKGIYITIFFRNLKDLGFPISRESFLEKREGKVRRVSYSVLATFAQALCVPTELVISSDIAKDWEEFKDANPETWMNYVTPDNEHILLPDEEGA